MDPALAPVVVAAFIVLAITAVVASCVAKDRLGRFQNLEQEHVLVKLSRDQLQERANTLDRLWQESEAQLKIFKGNADSLQEQRNLATFNLATQTARNRPITETLQEIIKLAAVWEPQPANPPLYRTHEVREALVWITDQFAQLRRCLGPSCSSEYQVVWQPIAPTPCTPEQAQHVWAILAHQGHNVVNKLDQDPPRLVISWTKDSLDPV